MQFVVPGKVKGKARPRWGNGRTYTPKPTVEYEKQIASCFREAGGEKTESDVPIRMSIVAFISPPRSLSKKRRVEILRGLTKPLKKPDLDNVAKVVLDALNGVAYEDDSQVTDLRVSRRWDETERLEVQVADGSE